MIPEFTLLLSYAAPGTSTDVIGRFHRQILLADSIGPVARNVVFWLSFSGVRIPPRSQAFTDDVVVDTPGSVRFTGYPLLDAIDVRQP